MVQDSQSWNWRLGLAGFLAVGSAIVLSGNCALAQITPDGTLGAEGSTVTPNVNIGGLPGDRIDGGATRGTNLFHSFLDFNVGNGQRVYFANPVGIENILSRVTGNNLSNILGTLGVDGGANLFLLNPNGIIFGENAKLDIAGSFVASTANSVVFNNGYQFSAKNPEAPSLLTASVPLGVQYGTNQLSTTIANSGNLAVGQNLTLSAGNVDVQGQLQAERDLTLQAQDTVKVRDSSTSPFIAASGGNLLVQGNQKIDIFALNHPDSGLFSGGNMVLRSANTVGGDAHYWSAGSFRIEKLDGSLGDLSSLYDPIIRSLGNVDFFAYQGTSLHILAGGEVNIGTVIITGAETGVASVDYLQETVPLSNGKEVSINGRLQPTLDIRAGVAPSLIGIPGLTGYNYPTDRFLGWAFLTDAPTSANITIGDVWIDAPNGLVFITNQYQPNTALPGGDITITGAGVFGIGIYTSSSRGDGGSVLLDSRRDIAITNSGIYSSSDVGNSGDITLLTSETASLKNSFVFSNTYGAGEGGGINIQARQLLVTDGTQVSASTYGEGRGGSLIVNASQAVQLMGISANGQLPSGLFTETYGKGDGGNIQITTPRLLITDGAQVSASTYGEGKGGSLIVNASGAVQLIGESADGQAPSGLFAETYGKGDGGNVQITTPRLLITDGAIVDVSTEGEGKGGSLIVNASQVAQLIGTSADGQFRSSLLAQTLGMGDGGNVQITTPGLLLTNGAQVSASTYGEGRGGSLIVNASGAVQLIGESADGQFLSGLLAQTFGKGDGGNVQITTPKLLVQDGARVAASTFGEGKGGSLIVNSSGAVQLIGTSADGHLPSGLLAQTFAPGTGDAGNVQITTLELLVQDGARVDASTFGKGKGGSLIVNASGAVQLIGESADGQFLSSLLAQTLGKGDGGNVEITTSGLLVKDGAQVSVSTLGEGKGGSLIVNAFQGVQLMGITADGQVPSGLFARTAGKGDGGNIEITTPWLLIKDGAQVNVSTRSEGKGGSLIVNASQAVQLMSTSADGQFPSGLFAETHGKGDGGNIEITTPWLLVKDGARVNVSTRSEGRGGSLLVNASGAVQLIGRTANNQFPSGLFAETHSKGDGGNIEITTPWLLVKDSAVVSADTTGEGKGGSLIVNASQVAQLIGTSADGQFVSGLFAETYGKGDGGNVEITTPSLLVKDGAVVSVSTFGEGKGGSLIANAFQGVQLSDGGLFAQTYGKGDGGNVKIATPQLLVTDSAQVTARTRGEGNGGNLIINTSEQVQLGGAGSLSVEATAGGTAGNLAVNTNQMSVTDRAQVTVSSPQGQAGNLSITANSLTLNRGTISAETAKSDAAEGGANITLSGLDFLRMDNESLISASALNNANGGNVTIDSTLIVATPPTGPEGSDIIANAFQGNGGRVNVTTQGLFGIQFRPQRTPKNDITVSSTFGLSGEYTLNSPGVDPSRGLTQLPTNVVDPTKLIDRRCTPSQRSDRRSSFTITGRGGLPPSPNEPLRNEEVITNWITLPSEEQSPDATTPEKSTNQPLVEAQGWIINDQGQVVLTAETTTVTPQTSWLPSPSCPASQAGTQQ